MLRRNIFKARKMVPDKPMKFLLEDEDKLRAVREILSKQHAEQAAKRRRVR